MQRLTRLFFRDLLHKLFPAVVTSACLVVAYNFLPYNDLFPAIVFTPLAVTLAIEIVEMVLRSKGDTANISTILKKLEDMEARGQISSGLRRSIMYTLLDTHLSSEDRLDIEVGESIRRHGDSLRTTLRN